jgi:hypothetical protein
LSMRGMTCRAFPHIETFICHLPKNYQSNLHFREVICQSGGIQLSEL